MEIPGALIQLSKSLLCLNLLVLVAKDVREGLNDFLGVGELIVC
jgi:hypothetical protein